MNIKIIEPIGQSETAIRSRLKDFLEKGGHIEPPLPAKHPIFKAPNTVLPPHVGFETVEAMSAKADIALQHLENFLSGRGLAS